MSCFRILRVLPLVLSILLLAACAAVRNPATGEIEYTVLSPEDELRIGRREHPRALRAFGGAYEDARLAAYLRRVGARIAARSDRPGLEYTFTLIDSPKVNAFALPGGYVYVTRGLLALVEDEAELAGVIAHEIGHIAARHAAQRYTRAMQAQLGAFAVTILGGVLGGREGARLARELGGLAAVAYVQGYSREQELEADELGVRYLARAGYDPMAMASFLDGLEAWERLERKLRGGRAEEIPSWLRSHPRTRARIREAADRARALAKSGRRERDALLDAIDGMVFGDSRRHGWVEGNTFVHPDLRFRFEVPEDFRLENTPRAVRAFGPRGRLLLFDLGRTGGVSLEAHIAQRWIRSRALTAFRRWRTAHGYAAAWARGRGTVNGRPYEFLFAVIAGGGDTLYRFAYAAPRLNGADLRRLEAILDGFRLLAPAEAARLRPLRLRIHRVGAGEDLHSLVRRMAVRRLPRAQFLVLNRLRDGARLEAGRRVKLVVR